MSIFRISNSVCMQVNAVIKLTLKLQTFYIIMIMDDHLGQYTIKKHSPATMMIDDIIFNLRTKIICCNCWTCKFLASRILSICKAKYQFKQ